MRCRFWQSRALAVAAKLGLLAQFGSDSRNDLPGELIRETELALSRVRIINWTACETII